MMKKIIHIVPLQQKRFFSLKPMSLAVSLVLATQSAMSAPQGGNVVGGQGNIRQNDNATTIYQQSERMAINWQSYNVAGDERVIYVQPDKNAIALNNILSNTGSNILGRIDANGQVILVNPNGIFFGENSVVNAGGILASGLAIDPKAFMNGEMTFRALEGKNGVVINSGTINAATGGYVGLVGRRVENTGLIQAELGSVSLVSGKEAYVSFDHSGLLGITVTQAQLQNDIGVDSGVFNSGEIHASGGKVLLSASASQDIFTRAMNTESIRQANSVVVNDDGSFTLSAGGDVNNSGTINVSSTHSGGEVYVLGENITHSGKILADGSRYLGGRIELHSLDTTLLTGSSFISAQSNHGSGGDIKLLGHRVGLLDSSHVSADASWGAGQILIGGDKKGKNPFVPNANAVYVGVNTTVSSSAITDGKAGKIILWGDDLLRAYGNIHAEGFGLADGGFIETSSSVVDLDLTVEVGAENGSGGEWLIDPWNITIRNYNSQNMLVVAPKHGVSGYFEPEDSENPNKTSRLSISSILTALKKNGNNSVLIETTNSNFVPATDQVGNIVLESDLDFNGVGNGSLILSAHNNIYMLAGIYDSDVNESVKTDENDVAIPDKLNVALIANADGVEGGSVFVGGRHRIGSSGETNYHSIINTQGGLFYAVGSDIELGFADYIDGEDKEIISKSSIFTSGGNVYLFSTGNITLHDQINTGGGSLLIGGNHDDQNIVAELISDTVNGSVNSFFDHMPGWNLVVENEDVVPLNVHLYSDINTQTVDPSGAGNITIGIKGDFWLTGNIVAGNGGVIINGNEANNSFNIGETVNWQSGNASIYGHGSIADIADAQAGNKFNIDSEINADLHGGDGVDFFYINAELTGSIDGGGGNDTFNLANNVTGGVLGQSGRDTYNVFSSITGQLNGGGGVDVYNAMQPSLSLSINDNADGGSLAAYSNSVGSRQTSYWQINIDGPISTLSNSNLQDSAKISFSGVTELIGGDGIDYITLNHTNAVEWLIHGNDMGRIVSANIGFTAIENLVGGVGKDVFRFDSAGSLSGRIDGGTSLIPDGTIDEVVFNNDRAVIAQIQARYVGGGVVVTNVESIEANEVQGIDNIFYGPDAANEWRFDAIVSGVSSGQLVSDGGAPVVFSGFQSFIGNYGKDDFVFLEGSDTNVNIDGGSGIDVVSGNDVIDTIDVSALSQVTIRLSDSTYSHIEKYIGNGTNSSLISPDSNINIWTVNNIDSESTLSYGSESILFSGFSSLVGGRGVDIFSVEDVFSGSLYGRNGDDEFNLQASVDGSINGDVGNDIYRINNQNIAISIADSDNNGTLYAFSDSDNIWQINEISRVSTLQNSSLENPFTVSFSGVRNMVGGNFVDRFSIYSTNVGEIHGGSGEDVFSINTANIATSLVGGEHVDEIVLNYAGETHWVVNGRDSGSFGSSGSLQNASFSNVERLTGGDGQDRFEIANEGHVSGFINGGGVGQTPDDIITINRETSFSVNLDVDGYVPEAAHLNIKNIEWVNIVSSVLDQNFVLIGENTDNTWNILSSSSGTLNSRVYFSGFNRLQGNNGSDRFIYEAEGIENVTVYGDFTDASSIAGAEDVVDLSRLSVANIDFSQPLPFHFIEKFIGNDRATVTSGDVRTSWTIDGLNQMSVNGLQVATTYFENFSTIKTGRVYDEFTVTEVGDLTGGIESGGGGDLLNLYMASGRNGSLNFNGGDATAQLLLFGGDSNNRLDLSYQVNGDGESLSILGYADNLVQNYQVNFSNIARVVSNVDTNLFRFDTPKHSSETEVNTLSISREAATPSGFLVNMQGGTPIAVSAARSLEVNGQLGDVLNMQDSIYLAENLSISNLAVNTANYQLGAGGVLSLNGAIHDGSVSNRFRINTPNLSLSSIDHPLFIEQAGNVGLNILELNLVTGLLDIESGANITSDQILISSNPIRLASNGDILLTNSANALTGSLSFFSTGSLIFNNGLTELSDVNVQNFTLNSLSNVVSSGAVVVSGSMIVNSDPSAQLQFNSDGNRFNHVQVNNAGTLMLSDDDSGELSIGGNVAQAFNVITNNRLYVNNTRANSINLSSAASLIPNESQMIIQGRLAAENNISLNAQGINVLAGVVLEGRGSETEVTLDGGSGRVQISSDILVNSTNGADISIRANQIEHLAGRVRANNLTVESRGGDVQLNSTVDVTGEARFDVSQGVFSVGQDGVVQSEGNAFYLNAGSISINGLVLANQSVGNIHSSGQQDINGSLTFNEVSLSSGSAIIMGESASVQSHSDVSIDVKEDFQVAAIEAAERIAISSDGMVLDNNGAALNLVSNSLYIRSDSGIGSITDKLDTSSGVLDIVNRSGSIDLSNQRTTNIEALITNGDIRFTNTLGNVFLTNQAQSDYDVSLSGTPAAGGVFDGNYNVSSMTLDVLDGFLAATPARIHIKRPEIIGDVIRVSTSDGFGIDSRPIVVFARTSLHISGPGIVPAWGFSRAPDKGFTTDTDLNNPSIVGSLADLLVGVETVGEVDPAVFTNIYNYAYEDISIRLPKDQLYEDDEDELRKRWQNGEE